MSLQIWNGTTWDNAEVLGVGMPDGTLAPVTLVDTTSSGPGTGVTWEETFATRDWDLMDQWYANNTGHDTSSILLTMAGPNITPSWLAANNGNGRVFQENGRWVVERYRFTSMVLLHADDLTLRNCYVDTQNATDSSALRSSPTPQRLIIEHCTLNGNNLNTSQGDTAIRFLNASGENQVRMRYCNIYGWRAGIYIVSGGVTAEYCWSHDLHFYTDSHNTAASIRGANSLLYRCHLTDGNSSALSLYAETGPFTNVGATECTFKSRHWFEVNTAPDRPYFTPQPGEVRFLRRNLFYTGGNFQNDLGYWGGIGEDITLFTELSGNIDRAGNPITHQFPPEEPPPPPPPANWQEAFDSRDYFGELLPWYQANTGHDPLLSYETVEGTLTVNTTWLNANNGNGRVSLVNGRWFVERYRITGILRIAADDITFTNIFVDSAGSLYGAQSRATDGNATGILIQHSTFAGNGASDNGATFNFPAARDVDQIVIRYCDISGFRAGIYCFGGITAEYNWVHDLHFSVGSHNTGASIRAGNVTLRRNFISDGNSSAISFYPEYGPYTGIHVEENALMLHLGAPTSAYPEGDPFSGDVGAEVIIANNRAYSELLPGQVRRLVGNMFYRGGNRGEGGGTGSRMDLLSEVSGNFDRMGEPVD